MTEIVKGDEHYYGCDLYDHLQQFGPWHILLRAHDHVWNNKGFPFAVRYEAQKQLWNLSIEVHKDQAVARGR